jgi:hypothetical protein
MRSVFLLSIVLGLAQTVPSAARTRTAAHWSVIKAKATALAPPVAASPSPPSRDAERLKTKEAGNPPGAQPNCEPPCVTVLCV